MKGDARRLGSALAVALVVAGCGGDLDRDAALLTGGDPAAGRALIRAYGCGSCHTVPGVPGANSRVGPPLVGLIGRTYIAGVVENTPENLVRWIMDPQAVDPRTAMPTLGLSRAEARDVAAYLYTVR